MARDVQRVQIIPVDEVSGLLLRNEAIQVEASISESHEIEVKVTDHPVEQGADVSDHVQQMPETLQLEGLVSNTPIRTAAEREQLGDFPAGDPGLGDQAYARLRQLTIGQLVTVVTSLRTYNSMLINKVSVPRNAGLGEAVQFSLGFRHLRTVTSETVQLLTANTDGQPKKKIPKQTPTPVAKPAQAATELAKIDDALDKEISGGILSAIRGQ